ncbi:MAG TPA: SDR family NAD(P)-dependent oxidoreductase [Halioglobus sp.]
MNCLSDFRNKRILVTGASSGIGRLLCLRLAEKGARLVLVARRIDELESLKQEVEAKGSEAIVIPCDVRELAQVTQCVNRAMSHYGNIDMLVNNAGYGNHRPFVDWPLEDIENIVRVNYLGSVYFTKLLLPQMIAMKNGCILFIASVAGKLSTPDESAYCAAKHAVVGMAGALSLEVEDDGVYVCTVNPGAFDTPFFKQSDRDRMPPVAKKSMGDPNKLVDHIFKSLAKGLHDTTYPFFPATGYAVNAIAPEFMRRQVKKVTIDAMKKLNK